MTVILETARLIVRQWTTDAADVDAAFAIYSDPEVTRYLADNARLPDKEMARRLVASLIADYAVQPGLGYWAIVERETGAVIGTALLAPLDRGTEIEVGYHLAHRVWGRGYATEIARALVAYGFGELHLPRIVGRAYPANAASRHVLEKAGFHFMGCHDVHGSELAYYEATQPPAAPTLPPR